MEESGVLLSFPFFTGIDVNPYTPLLDFACVMHFFYRQERCLYSIYSWRCQCQLVLDNFTACQEYVKNIMVIFQMQGHCKLIIVVQVTCKTKHLRDTFLEIFLSLQSTQKSDRQGTLQCKHQLQPQHWHFGLPMPVCYNSIQIRYVSHLSVGPTVQEAEAEVVAQELTCQLKYILLAHFMNLLCQQRNPNPSKAQPQSFGSLPGLLEERILC